MNVRFFAGTKADYLSLPSPRNPLGLYFCADTKELFWADRLLTDGTRIVATEADLPSPEKAADGITYYVEKTRNGYVLSADRTKWIQVIYAPEVGSSSVKAISFAGIELEEVDGVFTIDRRCAREALGFIVPDGLENEDVEIATKEYVDSQISKIPGADIDLSAYYTKSETETVIKTAIDAIEIPDVADLATKDDITAVEAKIPTDYLKEIPSEYVTDTELSEAIANIEHPTVDLSDYATIESVENVNASVIKNQEQLERVSTTTETLQKTLVNLDATTVKQKYEVLPIEGMLIQYRDGEIRLNTQRVIPSIQQVGETGNPNMYYATFRAFAPEGATQCKEGLNGNIDAEYSALATDTYGRKYTTIWSAIANTSDGGTTWTKWGDSSNLDKYLGFYYHFEWYNGNTLIGTDKVRVILTNDSCHDDLVSDAVARRIDNKVGSVNSVVNNITEQVQNIQENYVTEEYLTNTYVTNETLEEKNYVTNTEVNELVTNEVDNVVTEQIETKVIEVIQEKVDAGEISVTSDRITYGEF